MTIKDEHWIERQGKRMVLYSGLLDEAHQRGLLSIDTELIQSPGPDNNNTAIVKARVGMRGNVPDSEGEVEDSTFSGIGDANPENVGKNIKPHLIRMAETRAKARALRDAVNVHALAFEELGGDTIQDESEAVEAVREGRPETTPGGATRKAAGKLWHLVGGKNGADEWQKINGKIEEMSAKRVSDWIRELS